MDAATLLREARWAVDTWELALLEAPKDRAKQKLLLRKAHAERLRGEHGGGVRFLRVPPGEPTPHMLTLLLNQSPAGGQAGIHQILAAYPLPKLEQIYAVVFEKVLNEKVSTQPVAKR
ncbi:MAG TPA: hypothetical protein VFA26_08290 [Gemmataceae bacterium]|nr:hypothetical protein [Gemmataceae bacterium]